MREYMASYGYDGGQWCFYFYATDMADAERHLAAIKAWGKLDGEVKLRIAVPRGMLRRFVEWLHGVRPGA